MSDTYVLGTCRASAIAKTQRGEQLNSEEGLELTLHILGLCVFYKAEAEALLFEVAVCCAMESDSLGDWGDRAWSLIRRETEAASNAPQPLSPRRH